MIMAIRRPVMLNNLVHKPSALGVVVGVTICLLGVGPRLDTIDLVPWVHCNLGGYPGQLHACTEITRMAC